MCGKWSKENHFGLPEFTQVPELRVMELVGRAPLVFHLDTEAPPPLLGGGSTVTHLVP